MTDDFDFSQFDDPELSSSTVDGDEEFDFAQFDLVEAPDELSVPEKITNIAKAAGERAADVSGALLSSIDIAAKSLEEKYPLGGFVWNEGDALPTYLSGKEFAEKQPESIFGKSAETLKSIDLGYTEQKNWQDVKDAFSKEGALSGSAYADVVEYGLEQGLKSVPDMVGAVFALPAYLLARSEEIGQERATNKGKESAELEDILEAAPFAIGSALLERIGAKGMTSDVVENVGKEMLKDGIKNAAKKIAKEGAKGLGKEAATEFIQEGMLEYVGEKYGTDAKMSFEEALDRGLAGAVAGGVTGGAISTTVATGTELLKDRGALTEGPLPSEAEGDITLESVPEQYRQPVGDPTAIPPISEGMEPLPAALDALDTEVVGSTEVSSTGDALTGELESTQEVDAAAEQQGQVVDALGETLGQAFGERPVVDEVTEPVAEEVVDEVEKPRVEEAPTEPAPKVADAVEEVVKPAPEEVAPEPATKVADLETELAEKKTEVQKAHDAFDMVAKDELEAEAAAIESEIESAKKSEIDDAAHEAQTSPENDLAEPTEAQIEAGNYKKGHVTVQGLNVAVENPAGSTRSGTDESGKPWSITMKNHYGYIKRTEGADGEQVDVFIGDNPESDKVFVIDQINPATGKFDEHKVILGTNNLNKAKLTYNQNYAKGWKGMGTVTEMTADEFKTWIKEGDTSKALGEAKAAPAKALKDIKIEREGVRPDGTTVKMKSRADVVLKNIDKKRDVAKRLLRCVNG